MPNLARVTLVAAATLDTLHPHSLADAHVLQRKGVKRSLTASDSKQLDCSRAQKLGDTVVQQESTAFKCGRRRVSEAINAAPRPATLAHTKAAKAVRAARVVGCG